MPNTLWQLGGEVQNRLELTSAISKISASQ